VVMMILERKNKAYNYKTVFIFLLLFMWLISSYTINTFGIIGTVRPLIRSIENRIVLYKTRNFNELETDTYIFRYENIDKKTLDLIINTAEDKYKQIADIFPYKLEDKVLIVVYNNTDLMMNTTMLSKGDPPMGVYYGDSIHIANPELWVDRIEELDYKFYNEGPMLHELVHLFTDHVGRGNFPMWFAEGVSLYFEYMIDGYEWGEEVIFSEKDYTIEELSGQFKSLNQYEAYTKSFRLVKTLVQNHGLDQLIDIITSLGNGHSLNEFIYLFEEI